ncbi:MAG: (4Fe-4S)-binding protein [Desulfuromonadales bacterium GWD2_61_12]|nr:MAG: (4Fe-4S)-binding protein [Desulfuromonadales bacterium GWC2_61_20]OGR32395.1 MAG: (4Fe-4S)-binding protein [Desulfuromonadales bacterium GWD2_61_12]HAD04362.1 (4Fe-4S)-binding protein [Desulfuromonas sp.]HBT83329.1 (4Fe-4S)-binding protein [Desulfuromonas sp.]
MKERVALTAAASYDRAAIEAALERLLTPLGGLAAFVRPGARVLLKPNMLAGKAPDQAVTTHPEVVRAVILQVQRAGGIVSVGDSPGVGTPRQVAQRCGILDVINETGAHFAPFAKSVPVAIAAGTFHHLELARDILDAEVVINLPKLKTHQMMGMTCGVKNLFGAVVGMRKPQLHLQAGTDKAFFALMLLELAEQIRPALTIVDAVTGMEGDGPGSGDPVQIGALLAGSNPLAVDSVAIALTGLRPETVWTQQIARRRHLPGSSLDEVEILGAELATLRIPRFRPAKSTDVNFGLPPFLSRPLRRTLTARPVVDRKRCRACGLCVKHCPPAAMLIRDGRLHIDEHACIRCFCCQELCPHAALETHQGALLRLQAFLARE